MDIKAEILSMDAGGTMTDTIIIDEKGVFTIGKAASNPHDESMAFSESIKNACSYWNTVPEQVFPDLVAGIYAGTAMLNRLLERRGNKVGLLVTRGMEDYLLMERGLQTYLGYHYSDRLHAVTHIHNEPLVPRDRIFGITGRIDQFGKQVIPLYEHEVKEALKRLLEEKVDGICVNFLFSYISSRHEKQAAEILNSELERIGQKVPVYLSSNIHPVRGDFPRLNCLLLEAYAAEPSRAHLLKIKEVTKKLGAKFELQIMAAHGGSIDVESTNLYQTVVSGPIGGIVGGRYLAKKLGIDNMLCSDVGGTSFDVGLITAGDYAINSEPEVARFKLNLPMIAIDSIGAGTGTIIKIDPLNNRIELGPESAGSSPGPICYDMGGEEPSITDCDVLLGLLNPDYFLGGTIKLNVEKAKKQFKEKVSDKLGMDIYQAAAGIVDLMESKMRDLLNAMVLGRGFLPSDYTLLCYGGGGPVHCANYSNGISFKDILVPTWAAAFSAYGCACGDYTHRADHSVELVVPPNADNDTKMEIAQSLNKVWDELKTKIVQEYERSGHSEETIIFRPGIRMKYAGQLDSLEIQSPAGEIRVIDDFDNIIASFEELYGKVYASAARFSEAGYQITEVINVGVKETQKPTLIKHPLKSGKPPKQALKGTRKVYWKNEGWMSANIYEMDQLEPGNEIKGLSIIEAPATTYVVPPDCTTFLNEYLIFRLMRG